MYSSPATPAGWMVPRYLIHTDGHQERVFRSEAASVRCPVFGHRRKGRIDRRFCRPVAVNKHGLRQKIGKPGSRKRGKSFPPANTRVSVLPRRVLVSAGSVSSASKKLLTIAGIKCAVVTFSEEKASIICTGSFSQLSRKQIHGGAGYRPPKQLPDGGVE